jgi:hypothetical protein
MLNRKDARIRTKYAISLKICRFRIEKLLNSSGACFMKTNMNKQIHQQIPLAFALNPAMPRD